MKTLAILALALVVGGCESPTDVRFKEDPGCRPIVVERENVRRGSRTIDTIPCGRPPTQ